MKIKLTLISILLIQTFAFTQIDCASKNFTFEGFCQQFHKNGKISYIKEFKNGEAAGIWMQFDEKGNMIKQLNTSDKKDSLAKIYKVFKVDKSDFSFDTDQDLKTSNEGFESWSDEPPIIKNKIDQGEEEILSFVEEEAVFIGGPKEMQDWIKRFLVYPKEAAEKGLKGKAYLKFVVEKDGRITNVSVIKGVPDCPECDKEAKQLIKKMPNWKAAKNGGKVVRSWMQLPINFTLK